MFHQYSLSNGASIIVVPLKDTQSLTTMIMYPVGSRYESQKMRGVSHYIEHLMFKGTKKRKNTLALTREIDRLGAEYNAFTGKEYTGYYIKTDASYTPIALDILSDMLFQSTFDPKEMEREKTVIVEEIKMYRDNPLMNIDNLFEEVLYQDCPLGYDIAGTEKHVLGYKRDDVLSYRDTYYHPSQMTIVLAGNVSDETTDIIETYMGVTSSSKRVTKKAPLPYALGPSKKANRIIVEHKQTDQAQLMLGFPAYSYHHEKEQAILSVFSTLFGGSMSSRLFIQIRERRGLAYMIRSGVETFMDTGYVYIRAGLDAANVNKAIALIQKEIDAIIEKGVTARELADAKTHIKGSLTLALEDSSFYANWYAKQHVLGKTLSTPEQKIKNIEHVTSADIQSLLKKICKKHTMRVALIGNIQKDDVDFV